MLFTVVHIPRGFAPCECGGVAALGDGVGFIESRNVIGEAAQSRRCRVAADARRIFESVIRGAVRCVRCPHRWRTASAALRHGYGDSTGRKRFRVKFPNVVAGWKVRMRRSTAMMVATRGSRSAPATETGPRHRNGAGFMTIALLSVDRLNAGNLPSSRAPICQPPSLCGLS